MFVDTVMPHTRKSEIFAKLQNLPNYSSAKAVEPPPPKKKQTEKIKSHLGCYGDFSCVRGTRIIISSIFMLFY